MHRIEATFGGISLRAGREAVKIPPHFLFTAVSAAAILSLSCVGASLIAHKFASEAVVAVPAAHHTATSVEAPADFGAMIVEPEWVAKPAPPNTDYSSVASLEASTSANIPLPSLEAFPLEPSVPRPAAAPSGTGTSQPQGSEAPRLENRVPLPPPRPPGLGEAAPPTGPQVIQPAAPASAVDDRNMFQKLLGLGAPPTPGPPATPGTQVASIAPESDAAVKAPSPPPPPALAATPTPERPGTGSGWFGPGVPQAPQGYDQQTAVYDISARTVYMPDGTRIEAHSGLGNLLDDPRHVDEQARGATPPHLYELTLREGSFHGVQALRLTPIGEGDVYGRAGLLAHPYMLGPNGDSNGCVSVKDYDAFLRAYENGQIKRLMVVASANQVIATAEPQSRSSAR
jgi:hypothetical protein